LKFRFQHDRIQQAAYALIQESVKAETHLKIGLRLQENFSPAELDARVFDVVNQLNLGANLIHEQEGRARLSQLNFKAGTKAKLSTAYSSAGKYFIQAVALLEKDAWTTDYSYAFQLHRELAECLYLTGKLEEAEEMFGEIQSRSKSDLDTTQIDYLQIRLYQVAGDYKKALKIALRAFRRLDMPAPESDAAITPVVEGEFHRATELIGSRAIKALIDLPLATDPRMKMLAAVLEASGPPVYMVRPALFAWVTLKLLNLSLEFGNSESSCYAYGIYALMLAASFGEVDRAYEFSQLAIALNEKFNDLKLKGCMLHLLGDHVNFWKHPIGTDLPILERGFRACLEGGDLIYSNYIAFQSIWHLWESGDPLDQVMEYSKKYLSFAQQSQHSANYLTIRLEQQFIKAWKGLLPSNCELGDSVFDEAHALAEIEAAQYGCGVVYYHIMKLILSYSFGRIERAIAAAQEAEKILGAAFSMPIETTYWLYRGLAFARFYETAEQAQKSSAVAEVRSSCEKFKRWSLNCAENFSCKHELLLGELARVQDDSFGALKHFEKAIQEAHKQNFTQYEALGCELAERVCQAGGLEDAAQAYAAKAAALYEYWGSHAKEKKTLEILPKRVRATGEFKISSATTTSTYAHQLDLISVLKASQSISSEIDLPKLLEWRRAPSRRKFAIRVMHLWSLRLTGSPFQSPTTSAEPVSVC
jgi:tetratricopeptide (TPR) repeat protein